MFTTVPVAMEAWPIVNFHSVWSELHLSLPSTYAFMNVICSEYISIACVPSSIHIMLKTEIYAWMYRRFCLNFSVVIHQKSRELYNTLYLVVWMYGWNSVSIDKLTSHGHLLLLAALKSNIVCVYVCLIKFMSWHFHLDSRVLFKQQNYSM